MKRWRGPFLLLLTPSSAFVTTLVLPSQHLHRCYHLLPLSLMPMTASTVTNNRGVCNNIRSSSTTCTGVDDDDDDGVPSTPPSNTKRRSKSKRLYSFHEARRIARGHGFDTLQEFMEYSCPGAYQIPKDANLVWNAEWKGWDDFLGLPLSFLEARSVAQSLNGVTDKASYLEVMENRDSRIPDDDIASRLPYRPDLKYKTEWRGWDDFLISTTQNH